MKAYITFHPKDRKTIRPCITGLHQYCQISDIVVIAPKEAQTIVKKLPVVFIDENKVVNGAHSNSVNHPRWGWYFQQILKLGIAWIEQSSYYLVVDADTVFLNPVSFFNTDGRPYYTQAWEFHEPYFEVFEHLLGFRPLRENSFIAHHMIFRTDYVREMCLAFKPLNPWWKNIAKLVKPQPPWNSNSQFSEYETYGHYIKTCHPEEMIIRQLRWRNSHELPSRRELDRLARDLDFCSFQDYLRDEHRLSRPWRLKLQRIKQTLLSLILRFLQYHHA